MVLIEISNETFLSFVKPYQGFDVSTYNNIHRNKHINIHFPRLSKAVLLMQLQ